MNGKLTWGAVISIIPLMAGAYAWDQTKERQIHDQEHQIIVAARDYTDFETKLEAIEIKLKLFQSIEERRELTPEEQEEREALRQLRELYRTKLLEKRG